MNSPPQLRPLGVGVAIALSLTGAVLAFLPDAPLPMDQATLFLGAFDTGPEGVDRNGPNLVKSTMIPVPDGVFGTAALRVPSTKAVGLYRTPPGFDPSLGSVEMWVKPSSLPQGRATLFSLRGVRSLDGDAHQELIVGEEGGPQNGPTRGQIYSATDAGAPDFSTPTSSFPSTTLRGIASGDLDQDGVVDFAGSMFLLNEVHLFFGPLSTMGNKTDPDVRLAVPLPQGLSLADLDRDGDLDLVVCSFSVDSPPLFGFRNEGGGDFQPFDWGMQEFPPARGPEVNAVGDVDGDGVLDILYASFSNLPAILFYGKLDPQGRYLLDVAQRVEFDPRTLGAGLADMDGDGQTDVVLSRPGGASQQRKDGDILVYLNRGTRAFPSSPDFAISSFGAFTFACCRDLNNDGSRDIAVASSGAEQSRVHWGPDFSTQTEFPVSRAVGLSLGDMNGDGFDDLFLRAETGASSPLYLLDENGAVLERLKVPTRATVVGMGCHIAAGGTSPYGTTDERANSFSLSVAHGIVSFEVVDDHNLAHRVAAPCPPRDQDSVDGYHYLLAEWRAADGLLRLSAGDPSELPNPRTRQDAPFPMGAVHPLFHLGTDRDNQQPARGWQIDDLRISDQARSDIVCQKGHGHDAPGIPELSVCGQYLRPGNRAELVLHSAQASGPVTLIIADHRTPAFVRGIGAELLSGPWIGRRSFELDSLGEFRLPLEGDLFNGQPATFFLQALVQDESLPNKVVASNIVELRFQAP